MANELNKLLIIKASIERNIKEQEQFLDAINWAIAQHDEKNKAIKEHVDLKEFLRDYIESSCVMPRKEPESTQSNIFNPNIFGTYRLVGDEIIKLNNPIIRKDLE